MLSALFVITLLMFIGELVIGTLLAIPGHHLRRWEENIPNVTRGQGDPSWSLWHVLESCLRFFVSILPTSRGKLDA